MKVQRKEPARKTTGLKKSKSNQEADPIKSLRFTEILAQKDHDVQKEVLQKLLDEIDDCGRALVENRTVENLYAYKKMVKSFIEEVVEKGFEIREKRGFSRGGRSKLLRTVSEVDAKLVELTSLILKRESKEVNILSKIGEIQGLLVDLIL